MNKEVKFIKLNGYGVEARNMPVVPGRKIHPDFPTTKAVDLFPDTSKKSRRKYNIGGDIPEDRIREVVLPENGLYVEVMGGKFKQGITIRPLGDRIMVSGAELLSEDHDTSWMGKRFNVIPQPIQLDKRGKKFRETAVLLESGQNFEIEGILAVVFAMSK